MSRFALAVFLGRALLVACFPLLAAGCAGGKDGSDTSTETEGDGGDGSESPVTIIVTDEKDVCDDDEDCDDGNACNGEEACKRGFCARGAAINCNDDISCTIDRCLPDSGECEHEGVDNDQDGHVSADCLDRDGDPLGQDCDDEDPKRFPGNVEVCIATLLGDSTTLVGDGVDEDCDPVTVGDRDADGDGFVDRICFNVLDDGSKEEGEDCDDENASVSPLASEVCDHFDNNCDGEIDEGLTLTLFDDPDRDGYGGVEDPADPGKVILVERAVCPGEVGVTDVQIDCAPNDRLVSPDRNELCDGVDNDCDDVIDDNVVPSIWYRDFDGDGWGASEGGVKSTCERIDHLGWSLFLGDCDDGNAMVNPGQVELCDGIDNDCKPGTSYWIAADDSEDDDGDRVPDADCRVLLQDCNDANSTVYPGAQELCDGVDNDCNGTADTATKIVTWYIDHDRDGFGTGASSIESCEPIPGRVTKGNDCDDEEPLVHPEARDDCTGNHAVDDDCDLDIDEGEVPVYAYIDLDHDGYGDEEVTSFCTKVSGNEYASLGNDCDETVASINPGATEDCSPTSVVDRDCDGAVGCEDAQCAATAGCQALYGLSLVSPATSPFAAFVNQTFEVRVSLTDSNQSPIVGAQVSVEAPPGCLAPSNVPVTDSQGQTVFVVGVGMAEQAYVFKVKSGSTTPLSFTVSAQYPQAGTVWSVLNRDATVSGTSKESGFGPAGNTYYPRDIEVKSDGSAYVVGYYDVFFIDRLGQFTRVAGNGGTSVAGNGGPALAAGLGYPRFLALDEARQVLYIATDKIVRSVKLSAEPPTIHHCIGGGSGPVPGNAELADIGATIYGLEILSNGRLLVSTSLGLLEYDPAPTSKAVRYAGVTSGQSSPTQVGFDATYGPGIWQAGSRTLLWGTYLRGEEFGSTTTVRGIAGFDGTHSYRMVGRSQSAQTVEMVDGSHMDTAYIYSTIDAAIADSAGNLLFTDNQDVLWKVDTVTQRASRFAGQYELAGVGGEYVPRLGAQFLDGALSMDVGPDGDIWVAEYAGGGRVRRIRKGAVGTRSAQSISILSDDGRSYFPGQLIEPTVSEVRDEGGSLVSGAIVRQVPQGGWSGLRTRDDTDIDGIAFTGGRANAVAGSYSLQAQLLDLDRTLVDADVSSYAVSKPTGGIVTSWLNVEGATNPPSELAPDVAAFDLPIASLLGMTTTSDGTVYVSTTSYGYSVLEIAPNGTVSIVAGGNGAADSGDGLPATAAGLAYPSHLAVDEENGLLYIVCGSSNSHVRVVDLSSGIISSFAGRGAATGVNIPALDKAPWPIHQMKLYDGVLYLIGNDGVDIIDTTAATPTITTWAPEQPCSQPLAIYSLSNNASLAFAPDGAVYLHAYMCGTQVSGTYAYGIVELTESGTPISLLTGDGNVLYAPPHDAKTADGVYSTGMVFDSQGNIYFSEYSRNWLRKLTPSGQLSTVAGSPSQTLGDADFVPGLQAGFYYPADLAIMPDDSVLIIDTYNYSIRRYWP